VSCPSGFALPPAAVVAANRAQLVTFVRRVQAAPVEGTLTSWYRDVARNRACGGAASSKHLRALAVDVVPSRRYALRAVVAFQNAGLRVLNEGDHLHVELP
jgi:Peptidase M15